MSFAMFVVKIGRVIVTGLSLDEARASRLRALIAEELREKMASVREPVHPFEGEAMRIDLPHLSLETIEGERRVARAAADAVMQALRGEAT
jgi:hypothetical protein